MVFASKKWQPVSISAEKCQNNIRKKQNNLEDYYIPFVTKFTQIRINKKGEETNASQLNF